MSIIPCSPNEDLQRLIQSYAQALKTEAHILGSHQLSEEEFYSSGVFRGAIEQIRGEFSATMRAKREFARDIFNFMQDRRFISSWDSSGDANRNDYVLRMPSGKIVAVELKGCLDGNNTNIFERPPQAQEFVIWSICTNPGANPRHNTWSGIHTRLSAEIISKEQVVDGVIIWDMVCGTVGRPCPKLVGAPERSTVVSHHTLPPPCIYIFPATITSARNNPTPLAQSLEEVTILRAFHDCFGGHPNEINSVDFEVQHRGTETVRKTRVRRNGTVVRESNWTALRRS